MKWIENLKELEGRPRAIALGNFDGLHLGHQKVIGDMMAAFPDLCATVLHFHPHPLTYSKGMEVELLMMEETFLRELEAFGVEEVVSLDFREVVELSPAAFFRQILVDTLQASALSCGYNYSFGKNARGHADTLQALCWQYGIPLLLTPQVDYLGEAVSSTRIRRSILEGRMGEAAAMLTRPFSFCFEVVSGDKKGRLLGFPTINQPFPKGFVHPHYGVYASRARVEGKWMPALTNFGVRPTVQLTPPRAETCILGYDGDLYGQRVEVSLLEYLREEIKFPTLEEMVEQIKRDLAYAEQLFQSHPHWINEK